MTVHSFVLTTGETPFDHSSPSHIFAGLWATEHADDLGEYFLRGDYLMFNAVFSEPTPYATVVLRLSSGQVVLEVRLLDEYVQMS